jgi:hypothetical protein
MQHVVYRNIRLNVEPKTQKSYQNNYNNVSQQGNMRHNNNYYQNRGGRGGGNGSRGTFRNNGNYPRRGGQYRPDSMAFDVHNETNNVPAQS